MEQLDRVYSTFTNLESNYKRSKKTRTEYVLDKFGGDIDIGSMVILDGLAANPPETAEDIAKLSTIRNIFSAIKKHAHNLDALTSFNFLDNDGAETALMAALDSAYVQGTGIKAVSAKDLGHAKHYHVQADGVKVVPIATAEKIHIFNDSMRLLIQERTGLPVRIGEVYAQASGGHLSKVD